MINKISIGKQLQHKHELDFYCIKNPILDRENKKYLFLEKEVAHYKLTKMDNNFHFKKVSGDNFPETIEISTEFPNLEGLVPIKEEDGKAKSIFTNNFDYELSFFKRKDVAEFAKLDKIHQRMEEMTGMVNSIKRQLDERDDIDDKLRTKLNENIEEFKTYIDQLESTDYFEEYEELVELYPELAAL